LVASHMELSYRWSPGASTVWTAWCWRTHRFTAQRLRRGTARLRPESGMTERPMGCTESVPTLGMLLTVLGL